MNKLNTSPDLIMIGASTGGPQAILTILSGLPDDYLCPIVVTQHMPESFISNFVKQLDKACALRVTKATNGEIITSGVVYVSAGDKCLKVSSNINNQLTVAYEKPTDRNALCPSVNSLFVSATSLSHLNILAIILTGIGDDGTTGAIELKKRGAQIWAQDKNDCVVYGMPKSVLLAGVVDQTFSLDEMRLKLREL